MIRYSYSKKGTYRKNGGKTLDNLSNAIQPHSPRVSKLKMCTRFQPRERTATILMRIGMIAPLNAGSSSCDIFFGSCGRPAALSAPPSRRRGRESRERDTHGTGIRCRGRRRAVPQRVNRSQQDWQKASAKPVALLAIHRHSSYSRYCTVDR